MERAGRQKKLSNHVLNNFGDTMNQARGERNKSKFLKFFTLPNYVDSNIHFSQIVHLFKLLTFHQ